MDDELKRGRRTFHAALVFAITAMLIVTSVSYAAASQPQWYTGGTAKGVSLLKGAAPLSASLSAPLKMRWTWMGQPWEITATGAECLECSIENAEIRGVEGSQAFGSETLKLTGATVKLPSTTCTVRGEGPSGAEPVGTLRFVKQSIWTEMISGKQYLEFTPSGSGAMLPIIIGGSGCSSVAGRYNILGKIAAESNPPLTESTTTHGLNILSSLYFGNAPIAVEGAIQEKLASGSYWEVK